MPPPLEVGGFRIPASPSSFLPPGTGVDDGVGVGVDPSLVLSLVANGRVEHYVVAKATGKRGYALDGQALTKPCATIPALLHHLASNNDVVAVKLKFGIKANGDEFAVQAVTGARPGSVYYESSGKSAPVRSAPQPRAPHEPHEPHELREALWCGALRRDVGHGLSVAPPKHQALHASTSPSRSPCLARRLLGQAHCRTILMRRVAPFGRRCHVYSRRGANTRVALNQRCVCDAACCAARLCRAVAGMLPLLPQPYRPSAACTTSTRTPRESSPPSRAHVSDQHLHSQNKATVRIVLGFVTPSKRTHHGTYV